jgi:DEAD/DEAH box helicase domain-containing protein
MREVILDLETKKAFVETGNYDPKKLGISYVGICRRDISDSKSQDEFLGFFEDELSGLWPILEQADRIIGFNIVGFDFPVLSTYYHGDFSSFPVLDILEEVKKSTGHRVSLDAIAKETLGVQKSGTGLDALAYYEQGKLDELAEYCLTDVRITRDIYDYGRKLKYLKFLNKWNRVVTVPVDFSYKDEEGGSKVQMSLGV